ncbi:MAG TPA: anaerobic C4-dicarboxylate transporter [Anaeromyxobacteraceae bacterium]|nr:anaerobic C4-dicarboxylate transporter [Anaeromyxobacteraceae bacterium]
MIWVELAIVLGMIVIGARLGGIGLGVMGGMGVLILSFFCGDRPAEPPIDVMLMIAAVCTAAGTLQAAKGMDYLVSLAEKALRKYPPAITYVAPVVAWLFTLFAGTGHVAYAILPVIAEVSREAGVRPERPLSISVIASQQAITASPISAATVALVTMLAPSNITLAGVLSVCIPSTLIGVLCGAFVASKMGKELKDDPEYQRRLAAGELETAAPAAAAAAADGGKPEAPGTAKGAVLLFIAAAIAIVLLGSFESLRPAWTVDGKLVRMGMANAIEVVMMTVAALMILFCKAGVEEAAKGTVFRAGMQAVIAIFGIAWMGDTFFKANQAQIQGPLEAMVHHAPWAFTLALFALSILLYSQAATVRTLMPLGLSIGLPAAGLVGAFPAVNGYFFIPNYPTLVAAINFDRTGTTRIGKYVLNHSFMLPGLVATAVAVTVGLVLGRVLL